MIISSIVNKIIVNVPAIAEAINTMMTDTLTEKSDDEILSAFSNKIINNWDSIMKVVETLSPEERKLFNENPKAVFEAAHKWSEDEARRTLMNKIHSVSTDEALIELENMFTSGVSLFEQKATPEGGQL